jgi:hypothetical protein
MNTQHRPHINVSNKSVKNIGGHIAGDVTTGDNVGNRTSTTETRSNSQQKPKVFLSFILPALIIAFATIIAAVVALIWPNSPQ